jgi:hypothetical protein
MRSKVRITCVASRLRSTSTVGASRLKSSITLKVRKRRPFHKASDMKSIDQLLLIWSPTTNGMGCRFGTRFFPRATVVELHQAIHAPHPLVIPDQPASADQLKRLVETTLRKAAWDLAETMGARMSPIEPGTYTYLNAGD